MSVHYDREQSCSPPRTKANHEQIGIAAELREYPGLLVEDRDYLSMMVHSNEIPTLKNQRMTLFNDYNKLDLRHTYDPNVQNKLIEIANKYPLPHETKRDF
jgi:hypothetical protein